MGDEDDNDEQEGASFILHLYHSSFLPMLFSIEIETTPMPEIKSNTETIKIERTKEGIKAKLEDGASIMVPFGASSSGKDISISVADPSNVELRLKKDRITIIILNKFKLCSLFILKEWSD